jgi:hypothetical protein
MGGRLLLTLATNDATSLFDVIAVATFVVDLTESLALGHLLFPILI